VVGATPSHTLAEPERSPGRRNVGIVGFWLEFGGR
jgi:hypothetical protein